MQQIPLTGALFQAEAMQTSLEASKLHLFISTYTPIPSETLADLNAAEATYSGYTAGGVALATWSAPVLNPTGGYSINSPLVNFDWTAPETGTPVDNIIGGWYLVDATGNLIADGTFNNPISMGQAGQGFPIFVTLLFGNPTADVQCSVFGQPQN